MDETPQDTPMLSCGSHDHLLSSARSASWPKYHSLGFPPPLSVLGPLLVTFLALILPLLLLWAFKTYRKMQEQNQKHFPFLALPQELRDMVYENLTGNPEYPLPLLASSHASSIDWMLPRRWSSAPSNSHQPKRSNWIFLANKQIYSEFMELLCKRATFHLTVSPHNYDSFSPDITRSSSTMTPRWKISPDTLEQIRSCDLKLVTTSSMLGVSDPRNMTSSEWILARQIRQELTSLINVNNLTLDAKAIGDPLWNPLWIWYHASQSFKNMGTPQSDTVPIGPKLNRITFSLDTWSPGENFIQRDKENRDQWTWYCMEGHSVGLDNGIDMTVREFCGKLYQDCRVCRPDMDSEDKDGLSE